MTLIHAQEKDKWKHMHAIVEGFLKIAMHCCKIFS